MSPFGKQIRELHFRMTAFARRCVPVLLLLVAGTVLGVDRPLFDKSLRPDLLTAEENQWLEAHPVIRVAGLSNYPPVEFFDQPGVFWGITSEYFNLIEHRLGYRFKFIQLSQEAWQRLDPVERGADVTTASAETPNRAPFWSYTKTYLIFPTYLITRRGVDDGMTLAKLSNARVAVVQGWAAEEYLRTKFPEVIVDPVPDTTTGLRKVSFGLVDAFVSELPVATEYMEKEAITNLKISGEAGYTYRLGISVRKDWPALLGILEKALATVTPEERKGIYTRWVKIHTPPPNEWLKHIALWGCASLLTLLAAVAVWNRMLSSQVRARTAEVRAELARRIEADSALRASEEKFSKAFRSSPDAIFMAALPTGRIVEVNEGACRLTGFARGEMIGRTSVELKFWYNSGGRDQYLATLKQCGRVVDLETEFCDKAGRIRFGLISAEVIEMREGTHVLATVRDISERKRAETERQRLNAQLLESENEERRRIARELHDTTAQHLAVIQMNLTRLRETAAAEPDKELLTESLSLTAQSVQEIRTLSYLLHPPLLDELGLAGALGDYASGFAKRSGIQVEVDTAGYTGQLPREKEMALFRVVQESLTNVHRHSGSTTVLIRLECDDDEVRLEVQDSGRGLPPDAIYGVGLRGMEERLSRIGGELNIESDAEGTTVLASVPTGTIRTFAN